MARIDIFATAGAVKCGDTDARIAGCRTDITNLRSLFVGQIETITNYRAKFGLK